MKATIDYQGRAIEFDGKPSAEVRQILKANGFRWSPQARYWWRARGASWDFVPYLEQQIRKDNGEPKPPDGACWHCKSPDGYFRARGAATPVLCDACHAESEVA
jgi:hypothetical protein